jgi:membrane-bound metal-dependent hydrolase YbcI (DUF457 family)
MDIFLHIVVNTAVAHQLSQDNDSRRVFILGGIVPDMDVLFAWIPIVMPHLFVLQHRGLFHTVFAAPFIVSILIFSTKYFKRFNFIQRLDEPFQALYTKLNFRTILWGVLGVFIHLIMDTITPGGLQLFYPFIDQRITINLVSVIDPFVSVLSSLIVLRFTYNKLIKPSTYTFSKFKKSSQSVTILFVFLLAVYGFLQVNTIVTHSTVSTKSEIVPLFRWVFHKDQDAITIQLVNQLTQNAVKTYKYPSLTFNQTAWNATIIDSIITQAKNTFEYKSFKFNLESEVYLAVNATFNGEENRWEVSFQNTFLDAQLRFYGFSDFSLMRTKEVIHLNQP